MRIVIAPDKFKGSLTASAVIRHLAAGIRSVDTGIQVIGVPVADGGEGTLDAALARGYTGRTIPVTGPTGQTLDADFAVHGTTAVIEMAAASGLAVLPGGVPDARRATSRGTGELVREALDLGCIDIILAIGGSASTDGGAGLLSALGARFTDADGAVLPDGGAALARLAHADLSALDPRLRAARLTLASDVDNPLLGPEGAARVFAPQKGATAADVDTLEHALVTFARVLTDTIGPEADSGTRAPGAGAAGGVGYAATTVLGAHRQPGIEVVMDLTGLPELIAGADLVVTGEGSLDEQSLRGKAPLGVGRAAREAGVPVIAVCGRTTLTERQLRQAGFDAVFALTDYEPDVAVCIRDAGILLERIGALIPPRLAGISAAAAATPAATAASGRGRPTLRRRTSRP